MTRSGPCCISLAPQVCGAAACIVCLLSALPCHCLNMPPQVLRCFRSSTKSAVLLLLRDLLCLLSMPSLVCLFVCYHCDVVDFRCVTKTITMTKTMIMYLCLAQVPNTANIISGGVALDITQAPPQEICDG